jgi:hypothetical protein
MGSSSIWRPTKTEHQNADNSKRDELGQTQACSMNSQTDVSPVQDKVTGPV